MQARPCSVLSSPLPALSLFVSPPTCVRGLPRLARLNYSVTSRTKVHDKTANTRSSMETTPGVCSKPGIDRPICNKYIFLAPVSLGLPPFLPPSFPIAWADTQKKDCNKPHHNLQVSENLYPGKGEESRLSLCTWFLPLTLDQLPLTN